MSTINHLLVISIALSLLSCAGEGPEGDPDCGPNSSCLASNLDTPSPDSRWVLKSYGSDAGGSTPAVDAVPFTYAFNITEQGQPTAFYGFDGCNLFGSADVLSEGNTILPVNGVSIDTRSCGNLQFAGYLMQFDYFYSVISDSFSYGEVNNQLILMSPTGNSLTFEPCVAVNPDSLDSICEPMY